MNDAAQALHDAYAKEFRPRYIGFMEKLADEHLATKQRPAMSWERREVAHYLDSVITAYLYWEDARYAIGYKGPEDFEYLRAVVHEGVVAGSDDLKQYRAFYSLGPDPVDEQRVREAIVPYVERESDRQVFVAMCKQIWRDVHNLRRQADALDSASGGCVKRD